MKIFCQTTNLTMPSYSALNFHIDQIIISILSVIFPEVIAQIILNYFDSYFCDNDVENSIQFYNELNEYYNDLYWNINKVNLEIHDFVYHNYFNQKGILIKPGKYNDRICIACHNLYVEYRNVGTPDIFACNKYIMSERDLFNNYPHNDNIHDFPVDNNFIVQGYLYHGLNHLYQNKKIRVTYLCCNKW